MNTRRIAIVVPALELAGGVVTVVSFLYSTMKQANYEVDLFSLAVSARDEASIRLLSPASWVRGVQAVEKVWKDIPYIHIGAAWTEFEFQRYQPREILTKHLQNYDLIQVVAGAPAVGWAVSQVNKPTCIFVATTIFQERETILTRTHGLRKYWLHLMTHINAYIETQALKKIKHVFAESLYTQNLLSEQVRREKISLGIPGIDIDFFYPGETYQADSYLLSVSRFADPRKNLALLLRAYRMLRDSYQVTPRLVLAGLNLPTDADWSLAEKLGLVDYIDVYHRVSFEELAKLYRDSALFVLSSDEEGLGLVILEAMASGIPVVSTRCGGPETAVIEGETGYLTPVGDADALAKKIQFLLERPALGQKMGQRAREVAEARFSLEVTGQVYLQMYDELLSKANVDATDKEK